MGEHLFDGLVVAVSTPLVEGNQALVTIATEDIGDLVMGQRVAVMSDHEEEATDG